MTIEAKRKEGKWKKRRGNKGRRGEGKRMVRHMKRGREGKEPIRKVKDRETGD